MLRRLLDWLRPAPPPPTRRPGWRWQAEPGDVVWAAVEFVDQPGVVKDRPVLVVGREAGALLVLAMSTQEKHSRHRDWVGLGTGPWDRRGRPSWVRLHPHFRLPENVVRRPGGVLDAARFAAVRAALARDHGWTFPRR